MVEIISIDGDNIIGCRIEGKINREDMEKLSSITEQKLRNNKKLRVYVEVEELDGISLEAFLEDLKLGFRHFRDFEKKAVVTDHKWVNRITPLANRIFPGIETKCFSFGERETAKEWIKQ